MIIEFSAGFLNSYIIFIGVKWMALKYIQNLGLMQF